MGSRKLFILIVAALFLVVIIAGSLTLIGDSHSVSDGPSGNQTAPSSLAEATEDQGKSVSSPPPPDTVDRAADARSVDVNSGLVKASLPLFRLVGSEYLRGAQPARGGVDVLGRFGVKTIVDLRSKYDRTPAIAAEADQAGLAYYWLPLSVWDPPTDAQTAEFLAVVADKSRCPVFVFCTDGVNRTGEMTAIYRMTHDGWNVDQAVKEMDDAGFSPYYYSLRNYVWAYARTHKGGRISN
jgi:protein tyrosine phosphatase (PTP) superfamily phosphohydrolase (DUF442 family)